MRALLLLTVILSAGCVSGQAYQSRLGAGAEIAIIRLNTLHGAAIKAPIYVDGTNVAVFGKCEWMVVEVSPGRHVVRTDHGSSISVVVGPGRPAFVLVDPISGALTANFLLKEITRAEAGRHAHGCRKL